MSSPRSDTVDRDFEEALLEMDVILLVDEEEGGVPAAPLHLWPLVSFTAGVLDVEPPRE